MTTAILLNHWIIALLLCHFHCSSLDTLASGLCQFTPIWHFCHKYPQTPALSEHGRPPHFTAVRYSTTPSIQYLMDRLHWLPIHARIDFKILTLTYKTLSSGQLAHLRELISPYQPSRSLRSGNQLLLTIPHANLTTGQRVSYSSPIIWHAIPLSLRDAPSISTFKNRLKSFFFHSFVSNLRHLATTRVSDSSCLTVLHVISSRMYTVSQKKGPLCFCP